MKKTTLLILFFVNAILCVNAQTTLYSEDFNGSMGSWQSSGAWAFTTTGGDYGGQLASTTASNGYLIIDSDGAGDNATQDDDLISPAIDCSNASTVVLSCEHFFRQYGSSVGTISVSNDGSTYTDVYSVGAGMAQNDGTNNPEFLFVNLSSVAAGQSTVYVKFNYTGAYDYWWLVDDIEVFIPADNDIELLSINPTETIVGEEDMTISGTVRNDGVTPITSFNVTWDNGITTETDNVTAVNIGTYETYDFTHSVPVSVAGGESVDVDVSVSIAAADADLSNDSLSTSFVSLLFIPTKVVVGEEATGTWCGFCPRGHVYMEYMKATYPDTWIGVAVHNADPMAVADYDTPFGAYIGGYPSGAVDRSFTSTSPEDFEAAYDIRINELAPADIDVAVEIDDATGELSVTAQAIFASEYATHGYRFGVVIIENDVTGTTSAYDQTNYYSGGNYGALDGAGHDWVAATDPVAAADMVYQDVGRAVVGGFDGLEGSLPTSVDPCEVYTYDFAYTLADGYIEENFEIAVFMIDTTTGEILNAKMTHIGESTISEDNMPEACKADTVSAIKDVDLVSSFNVFPNPASGILNVQIVTKSKTNLTVELVDVLGRRVATTEVDGFLATFDVSSVTTGVYLVNVMENGKSVATSTVMVE